MYTVPPLSHRLYWLFAADALVSHKCRTSQIIMFSFQSSASPLQCSGCIEEDACAPRNTVAVATCSVTILCFFFFFHCPLLDPILLCWDELDQHSPITIKRTHGGKCFLSSLCSNSVRVTHLYVNLQPIKLRLGVWKYVCLVWRSPRTAPRRILAFNIWRWGQHCLKHLQQLLRKLIRDSVLKIDFFWFFAHPTVSKTHTRREKKSKGEIHISSCPTTCNKEITMHLAAFDGKNEKVSQLILKLNVFACRPNVAILSPPLKFSLLQSISFQSRN